MHSKRKIPDSWPTGWIAKACTSFVLYLNVFKNHLYYLRHIRVLSIKPCLHTQLPEHNKSYGKVSRGWGHLITWNGTMMGHLNNFSASGGGNLNKKLQKFKCPAGGGDVEASIWLVHYCTTGRIVFGAQVVKKRQSLIWPDPVNIYITMQQAKGRVETIPALFVCHTKFYTFVNGGTRTVFASDPIEINCLTCLFDLVFFTVLRTKEE